MSLNLAYRLSRRAALTTLAAVAAAASMAIAASPALAADTGSLTQAASASQGSTGAPLTITYASPATTPAVLSAASLALPINWNPGVLPAFNTGLSLGTMTVTTTDGTQFAGNLTVTGTFPTSAALTVTFPGLSVTSPPPAVSVEPLTVNGAIDITNHVVNFTGFPAVPITGITLAINGGSTSPVAITCKATPGNLVTTFTGADGTSQTVSGPMVVGDCPAVATAGRLSGAGKGTPALSFRLAGADGGMLTKFTVKLPAGLGIVKADLKKGVKVGGGKVKSISGAGAKLNVTLAAPVAKVNVTVANGALKVAPALQAKVQKKKAKGLSATVAVAGVPGTSLLALSKVS